MIDATLPHVGTTPTDRQGAEPAVPPAPGEAASRALAEAEARRAAIDARAAAIAAAPERDGRGGLEPVRYLDWEINGRAIDF